MYRAMLVGDIMVMFDAILPRTTLTAAGSGKEKDKLIPKEIEETVSEQVQGVAQQQGVYTIIEECMYPQSNVGL